MKQDTMVILAITGIVGYGLLKSDFFKGIGKVGSGVGEAFEGVGSGVSTIGREAGDIIVDVGSILEPAAAMFQGQADYTREYYEGKTRNLRRETEQTEEVDVSAHDIAKGEQAEIQAGSDINTSSQKSLRKSYIEDNKTDFTRYFTQADEAVISGAKSLKSGVSKTLRNIGENVSEGASKAVDVVKSGISKISKWLRR